MRRKPSPINVGRREREKREKDGHVWRKEREGKESDLVWWVYQKFYMCHLIKAKVYL